MWWGTGIEALSALLNARRQGRLSASEADQSMARLRVLRKNWHEIEPSELVRSNAERMLRIHDLRAGDALQLAAALIWCDMRPRDRAFVSADVALSVAAEAEGFKVVQV